MPDWHHNAATDFYAGLNAVRHAHPALWSDNPNFELISKTDTSLCFKRTSDDDQVTVSVLLKTPWTWSIETADSRVARVEPPCWWTGMKTDLQLMVYGDDISSWNVSIDGDGLKVTDVHKADSPNYLFVDVAVSPSAKSGTYNLVFTKGNDSFKRPYEILTREPGSAERTSFTTSDFIYLINPDRFANADPGNDNNESYQQLRRSACRFTGQIRQCIRIYLPDSPG